MHKKMISLLLCAFLMLGMAVPAYAEEAEGEEKTVAETVWQELTISTAEEFLEFAENCRLDTYSRKLSVTLNGNIDLTGHPFVGVPIFSGTFDGNGHRITGVAITVDGSVQGLFRYLTATATVRDLTVSGTVQPGGSKNEVGAIAGRNEGKIRNCIFTGTLSGSDYVGGIVGTNAVTGLIENCRTEGDIHGNHFVGGIAGKNAGVIRSCENTALVNTTPQQNSVEISDITLDTLTNTEDVNTVTDIGGIAGISSGVIRRSENRADVGYQHMGYNIGGIAGTQTGYIAECENYGNVRGRKEVGGIVGQMEPVSLIEYSEDALQILQGQLGTMSGLVNQASGNAQSNAGQITAQLDKLQDQARTAQDAVDAMFPDADDPYLPDADAILAAQNTLSTTLDAMPGTLRGIVSATQNTLYSLNRDLNAISGQISTMSQTLSSASENIGGTITDISDLDTPELLTAKVEYCENLGNVLADLNVGGIAGALAIENDLDMVEDWLKDGETSLNFRAEVRAVILNCQNSGTVAGSKQNVGGITGWQSLGLVKDSCNTGKIDAQNANYVGGISGLSTGYIRSDYTKCEIHGKTYVGGIAGSGTVVTNTLSQVKLVDAKEKQGAILGYAEAPNNDAEDPISGNIYLRVGSDCGGIDSISYAGLAEAMDFNEFMELDNLPELFKRVTVRFVFGDGTVKKFTLPSGGRLSAGRIPEIPEKAGFMASWEGIEDADLSGVLFDMTFEARYTVRRATIQSQETRENGRPILLVEGAFTDRAAVSVAESEQSPVLNEKQQLLEGWVITLSETAETARFLLPEKAEAESSKLLMRDESGNWNEIPVVQDGSYLVFSLTQSEAAIALVQAEQNNTAVYIAAAVILAAAIAIVCGCKGKKNRNKKEESEHEEG